MNQKTILYIITKTVLAGAPKYVLDLAQNLPKDEFEPVIAGGGKGTLKKQIIKTGIPYYHINNFQRSINPFKDVFAFFEVLSVLFKVRPDIIHTNSSKGGAIGGLAGWIYRILAGKKVHLVFTAHGWALAEERPDWQLSIIQLISQITALCHNKIICVSRHDKEIALENKISPEEKLTVIHNGLDLEKTKFLAREAAQKKLMGKTSDLVIGVIAEWMPNKGLLYLLEAIKKMQAQGRRFDTIIITGGQNPEKAAGLVLIKKYELKYIFHQENIPHAVSYLKALDIFVLPSTKEGLPYTILEAMLAQLPIIASNIGGIPEIIEDDISGILIEPKNSQKLADEITKLIDNPEKRKKIAQETNKKVREFSLDKMIEKTKETYRY